VSDSRIIGYVQAGGASSRFGSDKALAELGGNTMLERTCDFLRGAVGEVRIVAPPEKYAVVGIPVVPDQWPGEGPLGGIITALTDASAAPSADWALIVSSDMPFLSVDWLRFLAARASKSTAEALVPKSAQGWEPLCACWRVSAVELLLPLFRAGTRKVTDARNVLHVEVLDESEWKRFDMNGRLFWNMNTPADYAEARRVLREGRT
jgi:molybdopterin-guanine dinucleotide biosynthesis protein A